jgi:hypothetical protein
MIRNATVALSVGAVLLVATGCGTSTPDAAAGTNTQEAAMASAETAWSPLFDGTDLSQWRGFGRDDMPAAWQIENGTLAFVPGGEGGDIVTREQFGDFELELEWRISEGGNSGIFYRGTEDFRRIWESAPEYQVLDDDAHPDAQIRTHRAGDLYDLIEANDRKQLRPVGEWNQTRIVARGPHVEHWLNGEKIVEFEMAGPEWDRMIAESKFSSMPGFGRTMRGHIALQDHGDRVWYRNIRIRPLNGAS